MTSVTCEEIVWHCIADNFAELIGFDPFDPLLDSSEREHVDYVTELALQRNELAGLGPVPIDLPAAMKLHHSAYNILLELLEEGEL